MTLLLILAAAVGGVFLLFVFLNWLTARTYKPTRQHVADQLRKVLDGTMHWSEWDEFTHVPMRHDSLLEKIREACARLDDDEQQYFRRANREEQGAWIYNEKGLREIRQLLERLEQNI
jgi:hypothetical protein